MNLKSLSNQSLLQSIKSLVSQERRLSLEILWHLREIESRRLFLDLGYSSLFDYCLHELKYSESQAQRRISSSRLLKELPDLEEKVKAGALSLTTLSQAQSFFKKEEKITEKAFSKEDKLEILESLEAKSKLEVERTLLSLSSQPLSHRPDQERQVSQDHVELKITITQELKDKLDRLRNLLSHKNPHMSYQELLEELANLALKAKDPSQSKGTSKTEETSKIEDESKTEVTPNAKEAPKTMVISQRSVAFLGKVNSQRKVNPQTNKKGKRPTRYIPAAIRRAVWQRDQGQCQFEEPVSKRRCQSRHLIEIDHKHPHALGGQSTPENLRLLCFFHNQNQARKIFGTISRSNK